MIDRNLKCDIEGCNYMGTNRTMNIHKAIKHGISKRNKIISETRKQTLKEVLDLIDERKQITKIALKKKDAKRELITLEYLEYRIKKLGDV